MCWARFMSQTATAFDVERACRAIGRRATECARREDRESCVAPSPAAPCSSCSINLTPPRTSIRNSPFLRPMFAGDSGACAELSSNCLAERTAQAHVGGCRRKVDEKGAGAVRPVQRRLSRPK